MTSDSQRSFTEMQQMEVSMGSSRDMPRLHDAAALQSAIGSLRKVDKVVEPDSQVVKNTTVAPASAVESSVVTENIQQPSAVSVADGISEVLNTEKEVLLPENDAPDKEISPEISLEEQDVEKITPESPESVPNMESPSKELKNEADHVSTANQFIPVAAVVNSMSTVNTINEVQHNDGVAQ